MRLTNDLVPFGSVESQTDSNQETKAADSHTTNIRVQSPPTISLVEDDSPNLHENEN
jgi:hypothetical protein